MRESYSRSAVTTRVQGVVRWIERLKDPATTESAFGDLLCHIQASSEHWLHEPPTSGYEHWVEARDAGLIETILDLLDQPSTSPKGRITWQHGLDLLSDLLFEWEHFEASFDRPAYQNIIRRFLHVKNLRLSEYERSGKINGAGLIQVFMRLCTGCANSMAGLEVLESENVMEIALDYWFKIPLVPNSSFSPSCSAIACYSVASALVASTGGGHRLAIWKPYLAPLEAARKMEHILKGTASLSLEHLSSTLGLFFLICDGRPELRSELSSIAFLDMVTDCMWSRIREYSGKSCEIMLSVRTALFFCSQFKIHPTGAPVAKDLPALVAKAVYFSRSHDLRGFWTGSTPSSEGSSSDGVKLPMGLSTIIDSLGFCLWHNRINAELALEPIWLRTLDLLLDLEPLDHGLLLAKRNCPEVRAWLELGTKVGLEEKTFRIDALSEQLSKGLFGCNWHQCIFHSGAQWGASGVTWLKDQRCDSVQYCSVYCQKRDWHDGNHKLACQKKRIRRTH